MTNKKKVLEQAKELLDGIELDKVDSIRIETDTYLDGTPYFQIEISYNQPDSCYRKG